MRNSQHISKGVVNISNFTLLRLPLSPFEWHKLAIISDSEYKSRYTYTDFFNRRNTQCSIYYSGRGRSFLGQAQTYLQFYAY